MPSRRILGEELAVLVELAHRRRSTNKCRVEYLIGRDHGHAAFVLGQGDLIALGIGKCVGGQNKSHAFVYGITVLQGKTLHNIRWHQSREVVHRCGGTEAEHVVLGCGMLEGVDLRSEGLR